MEISIVFFFRKEYLPMYTHLFLKVNLFRSSTIFERKYAERKQQESFNELFVYLLYSFSNHLHKDSISDEASFPPLGISVYDE